ncbi:pyrophosphatase PpaX [Aquibacillus sp. 3ASR75-11]|uniref:Pyrophosphatase PpaX n=1 Tax=Terrihalobacillus insolitus TaxID=2950438 RepID=A0A9X3WQK3_9BACI|nr:pyrophosphatase PpaX [Terrihalobacillus insolitus]MDC3412264.1 pyrophosphatase PpaX [Terrihalobacillus insolitus]MDC3423043.1 pyrophosphatase PpaX [Terrihalobacillus insolitus]
MNIRTILFDLDGTLIDTNELIIASFEHTLAIHTDRSYAREEIVEFIGPPLKDSFETINANQVDQMIETYREHNLSHHDDYVTAYPTVVETIYALKQAGYKLGVVTTKMRKTVNMGLQLTGLQKAFDVVITLDDVTHAKPHPEPILTALTALDGNAASTIMVGDNYHDIEAGQNAGTRTAGVAWSIKGKSKLESYKPDYMLEQMSDLITLLGEEIHA